MKKIYLFALLCALSFAARAQTWYSVAAGGDVNTLATWNSLPNGTGASLGTLSAFLDPAQNFVIQSSTRIGVTGGVPENWTVAGNVSFTGTGKLQKNFVTPSIVTIGGSMTMYNNSLITQSLSGGNVTFNITGDMMLHDSATIKDASTSSPIGVLKFYVQGTLSVSDTAIIKPTGTQASYIYLDDTLGLQSISWTSRAQSTYTALEIEKRSTRRLLSDVPLPILLLSTPDSLNGSLDCGTYAMKGGGTVAFVVSDSAVLISANANGIGNATGTVGSLQKMASYTLSSNANYIFDGTVPQVTGVRLPSNIGPAFDSLIGRVTINNATGVTLSQATTFKTGTQLNLVNGTFSNGTNLTMNTGSTVYVDGGNMGASPTYTTGINVWYVNLGLNAPAMTTGYELQPTTTNGVNNVYIAHGGSTITVGVDAVVNDSVIIDSGILNNGSANIKVNGYWENFATVSNFQGATGEVTFDGTAFQTIGGTATTTFNSLVINNSAGVTSAFSDTVNDIMSLASGKFYLGTSDLYLGPGSGVAGAFSNSNMIVANTAGHLVHSLSSFSGPFIYPIGDSTNYSPATINFFGSTLTAASVVSVNVVSAKEPNNHNENNYLNRYWKIEPGYITVAVYTVTANYVPGNYPAGDVTGSESLISMGQYVGALPWLKYDSANIVDHSITNSIYAAVPTGAVNDFTGITTPGPSITVSRDTTLCVGASDSLFVSRSGDSTLTINWAPSTGLSSVVDTAVNASPTTTTTYTVTVTDGNGFQAVDSVTITVNAAPKLDSVTNNGPLCAGDTLMLRGARPRGIAAYAWAGPHAFSADSTTDTTYIYAADSSATGVYTVTVTNGIGIGCTNVYTTSATVSPLPQGLSDTGGGVFCFATIISAAPLGGISTVYFQDTNSLGVSDTGAASQIIYTSGTYYFRAMSGVGCWGPQDTIKVTIHSLPVQFAISSPNNGHYCANDTNAQHIYLDSSSIGIQYQLMNDGMTVDSMLGTGDTLDFGRRKDTGTYSILAVDTLTKCTNLMSNTQDIRIDTLPNPYPLDTPSHGGGYCIGSLGSDIMLSSSNTIDYYRLYFNGVIIDSLEGTDNTPLDFGNDTAVGIYTVTVQDILTGCMDTVANHDSVWVNPLPLAFHVIGGGIDCADGAGFHVKLDSSATTDSVWYELITGGVAASSGIRGNNDTLDFGNFNTGGTYIVVATDSNGCTNNMLDSAVITVNPLPTAYTVSMGSSPIGFDYCINDTAGAPGFVGSAASLLSQSTVKYYLIYHLNSIDSLFGDPSGGTITFASFKDTGNYSVFGVDTGTGCSSSMTGTPYIHSHAPANVYTVSGTGSFCSGGTGIDVQLSNVDSGVLYSLYNSSTGLVTAFDTTYSGLPHDFGNQTGGGSYVVTATTASPAGCVDTMAGGSAVTVLPLPTVYSVNGGGQSCFPGVVKAVGLSGGENGVTYQLFRADTLSVAIDTGHGALFNFGSYHTPGNYTVIATRLATGCKDAMSDSATIIINPLPLVDTLGGGGAYCSGTLGAHDSLRTSQVGINYTLYHGGAATSDSLAGTGSGLDFGPQAAGGVYTIVADNPITGCVSNMYGSATNISHPLPIVYTIAGGGNYCVGGVGEHIYLDGTNVGIHYQLLRGTVASSEMRGTGFGLNFGIFTDAGTYIVLATDTVTGCGDTMASVATININNLPDVHNVTGGGTFCANGTAPTIGLDISATGIRYQLFNGPDTIGVPVYGTGSAITFGHEALGGTYTVIATNASTLCSNNMSGSAGVTVNPIPAVHNVTGGGAYCAGGDGVVISMDGSDLGVGTSIIYQRLIGDTAVGGPYVGTGSAFNFTPNETVAGTYRVYAYNSTTFCGDTMAASATVVVNPLPTKYTVTGGGSYCTGGTGVDVALSGSDTGISYQLLEGTTFAGSPWAGSGSAIDFGMESAAGTYTVAAVNTTTTCTDTMAGIATVTIQTYATPVLNLKAYPDTVVGVAQSDTIIASVVSGGGIGTPSYQWYVNGNLIYGATSDTFNFALYFDKDTIVCDVTSAGMCGGITSQKQIIITLKDVGVQQVTSLSGDVKLIPNPNKGTFALKGTLGSSTVDNAYIEVTNMLGEVVYKNTINTPGGVVSEQVQLSSSLANGMYLLNLHSAAGNSIFHFVVEQ